LPSTIEKVHQDYKDAGLVVLPISIEEGRRKVTGWAPSRTLTMPLLLDPDGTASGAYRITATPTVFLVGRDGKLVAKARGTKPWTSEQGRALLQLLLKK
jgi:peroxiredoxin